MVGPLSRTVNSRSLTTRSPDIVVAADKAVFGLPEVDNGRMTVHIQWTDPNVDWDLYVLDANGTVVAQSAAFGDADAVWSGAVAHLAAKYAAIRPLAPAALPPQRPDAIVALDAATGKPVWHFIAGARVDVAPYKRDATDFVLWKPSKPGEPAAAKELAARKGRSGRSTTARAIEIRWRWPPENSCG